MTADNAYGKKVRTTPWLAWLLLGSTLLCISGMLILIAQGCTEILSSDYLIERLSPLVLSASNILFTLLGLLILYRRPGHAIGWICVIIGAMGGAREYTSVYFNCTAIPLPALDFVNWIDYLISPLGVIPLFILLPMLFPEGHFLTKRWRTFTVVGCVFLLMLISLVALVPGPMIWNGMGQTEASDNPYALTGLPIRVGPALNAAMAVVLIGLSLAGILSLLIRYRRSQGEERQQLKWIAYFYAVAFGVQILLFEVPGAFITPVVFEGIGYALAITAVFVGYPIVIGIAILRYQLFDIDIIIRRTLVYALVTGVLALVYVGSIIVLQRVFVTITGQQSTLAVVVSTLLIAALFNPLRRRVQEFIDRRFYRRKYDAESTLIRFGAVARDEVDLDTLTSELLDAVNRTVQPAGTSLWLKERQS